MDVSDYKLETLRRDAEFVLYRGLAKRRNDKGPSSLLILAPVLERPAPETLRRMEHELNNRIDIEQIFVRSGRQLSLGVPSNPFIRF
jgi:hypothetical protein